MWKIARRTLPLKKRTRESRLRMSEGYTALTYIIHKHRFMRLKNTRTAYFLSNLYLFMLRTAIPAYLNFSEVLLQCPVSVH